MQTLKVTNPTFDMWRKCYFSKHLILTLFCGKLLYNRCSQNQKHLTITTMAFSRNTYSTEYELIRTKLVTLCTQQSVKTIMFTACNEGDGVSKTALNLAITLASIPSRKVLLLEIRPNEGPEKNSLFDKEANDISALLDDYEKGLLNVNNPFHKLQGCGHDNLIMILAKIGMCPAPVLESESFKALLSLLREHFYYVILDAPPVTESSECLALAAQADGVVLVLRADHTRKEVAKNALVKLESTGVKLLGSVINMKKHHIPDFIYRRL